MKALEKDRTRRYETVNGLARDLERYLAGEPLEAAPPSTAYRMSKFVRRHRVWLATAAAFTALLIAGVVVSSWMAIRAIRAEREALLERNTAKSVNDFLQNDLLAQASASAQAGPGAKPDPDLKVRTALDRAAARIEGKFAAQPLTEASIRQTIGTTYERLGLYPEAQRHAERALELRRRVLGEQHADTSNSLRLLATLQWDQGKYAEAETLITKALDIQRRVLGEEHPNTLGSLNTLAAAVAYQGKYSQAEVLFARALDIQRRVLGQEHSQTLYAMNNLAATYYRLGKYSQAESLHTQALEIRRRVLGEEHPDTLTSVRNLAALYRAEGKYAEAQPLFTRALDIRRRVLGEEHPKTLASVRDLAALFQAEGKAAQAEPLLTKTLEIQRRVLGKEHPDTVDTLASLGEVRLQRQMYPDAEAILREALNSYEKTAPDSWQRHKSQFMLGASMAGQGRYAEAEALLLSGYQGLRQLESTMPAPDRYRPQQAVEPIVRLYEQWGKPAKAAEWKRKP